MLLMMVDSSGAIDCSGGCGGDPVNDYEFIRCENISTGYSILILQ